MLSPRRSSDDPSTRSPLAPTRRLLRNAPMSAHRARDLAAQLDASRDSRDDEWGYRIKATKAARKALAKRMKSTKAFTKSFPTSYTHHQAVVQEIRQQQTVDNNEEINMMLPCGAVAPPPSRGESGYASNFDNNNMNLFMNLFQSEADLARIWADFCSWADQKKIVADLAQWEREPQQSALRPPNTTGRYRKLDVKYQNGSFHFSRILCWAEPLHDYHSSQSTTPTPICTR